MSLADEILAVDDRKLEKVEVPEWNCTGDKALYVKVMNGTERDAWENDQFVANANGEAESRKEHIRARLIVHTVCDADGNLIFTPEQIPAVSAKSARALTRLFAKAQKVNGMTGKDIEELAKNSETGPSAGSTSH